MTKKILIPIYNDWHSLLILLDNLDKNLISDKYEVIIINDCSTEKENILKQNYIKIKKIKILNLSKNVGSQNCIAIGLRYLSQIKEHDILTVMDGDGEDDPAHVNNLFKKAEENPNSIITSNRLNRNEGNLFKFFYKTHLIITFLITFKWINFGNFTCFNSNNFSSVQKNNEIGIAVSAAISKNCKTYKCPSKRLKRYKDVSKVSYFGLFLHSLRILSVYYERIICSSILYTIIIFILIGNFNFFSLLTIISFFIFNIALVIINKNYKITDEDFSKIKLSIVQK